MRLKVKPLRQQLGEWAEQMALNVLEQHGFVLLYKNYYARCGEIDLIVQKANELIFVEVKARAKTEYGTALEVITLAKQRKIVKTSLKFLQDHAEFQDFYYRFDVVCFDFHQEIAKNVQHDFSKISYDLQWIENAFTLDADLINL
ncbi:MULTISPECIES: YraN family protein [Acinetobacter]|uniref:YraN family protein n=1 Tax=Acinetobacter TaxID=469 RepID=UPI00101FDACC|nr:MULTISPECIES: YraN family protein [Acinetobacter]MDM1756056.1 YraN family protein [Acinetobacter sp. 256-1]MDM1760502.1 YraN family protein [Acinetobacter sp. 251-1]RYL28520.1 YraN family protein [Acinetobacter piscicola]